MEIEYYVVDTFTNEKFKGNPAGVCVLESKLPDSVMQNIAFENNLSETAFVYKSGSHYVLRWFTPAFEIDLCGHATLAAGYVISNFVDQNAQKLEFETKSGVLTVVKNDNLFELKLPNRPAEKIDKTVQIVDAIGFEPKEIYSQRDLYIVADDEEMVKNYVPDYDKLLKLANWLGVVITARSKECDFVSRYFCPELKMEDSVTGSSHSSLVPLWGEKLKRKELIAKQLSKRGGTLFCKWENDVVKISGKAVLYMKGTIFVSCKNAI